MAARGTPTTNEAGSAASPQPANDPTARPNADYLRHLIRSLLGDPATAPEMREECHTLMLAINGNDLEAVSRSLARLSEFATLRGVALPVLDPEA